MKEIFHGGCIECNSQDENGIETCLGCMFFDADWSLPNLNTKYLEKDNLLKSETEEQKNNRIKNKRLEDKKNDIRRRITNLKKLNKKIKIIKKTGNEDFLNKFIAKHHARFNMRDL